LNLPPDSNSVKHLEDFHIPIRLQLPRNQKFTGRDKSLERLHELLTIQSVESNTNIVVVHGIGGVGKTQLVTEYAYRYKDYFSSIFWISGASNQSIELSMREGLNRLWLQYQQRSSKDTSAYRLVNMFFSNDLHGQENTISSKSPTHPIETKVFLEWLSLPKNENWLLIFDNVDDLETGDIRQYFPHSLQGNIIITSRRLELTTIYNSVDLDVMDEIDAVTLFSKTSALEISEETSGMLSYQACYKVVLLSLAEHYKAQKLVEMLGFLSLAIIQAGAYISLHGGDNPIHDYLNLFQRNARNLLGRPLIGDVWDYRNDTVLTTYEISLAAVEARDLLATKILTVSGFLSRHDIWEDRLSIGLGFPSSGTFTIH
jgi:hypothetical protein